MGIMTTIESLLGTNKSVTIMVSHPDFPVLRDNCRSAKVRLALAKDNRLSVAISDDRIVLTRLPGRNAIGDRNAIPQYKDGDVKASMTTASPTVTPATGRLGGYIPPPFHHDVLKILLSPVPHNLWFWGATGSGKSEYVRYLGESLGRPVYRINCRSDMDSASFFGDRTVVVDKATKQNKVVFQEGTVLRAMRHGIDAQGCESGSPAILYVDEAAAMPPTTAIMLNRLLETQSPVREVTLDIDGGRVVKSHSGFRVIFSANTAGRGVSGINDSGYTAQTDALDSSMLNRMDATFKFGYNLVAERKIVEERVTDHDLAWKLLQFRDAIRVALREGRCTTPFSTRTLLAIGDMYGAIGDITKAIEYAVFGSLLPEEVQVYNEHCVVIFGHDIVASRHSVNRDAMEYV